MKKAFYLFEVRTYPPHRYTTASSWQDVSIPSCCLYKTMTLPSEYHNRNRDSSEPFKNFLLYRFGEVMSLAATVSCSYTIGCQFCVVFCCSSSASSWTHSEMFLHWPLASTKPFCPENRCSLDRFSFLTILCKPQR